MIITPEEVIKKVPGNDKLDTKHFRSSIEIAEARFLEEVQGLGYDFYNEFTTQKNRLVTSSNLADLQQKFDDQEGAGRVTLNVGDLVNAAEFLNENMMALWVNRLWKYAAECVFYISIPENYLDFANQGLLKNNPIGSAIDTSAKTTVGADRGDVKFVMDKWLMERIEPLRMSLLKYLMNYSGYYPTFARSLAQPEKNSPYIDVYRDQDESRLGCQWQGNNPQRPGYAAGPFLPSPYDPD